MEEAAATALESVRVGDELGLRRRKGVWCRCDAAAILLQLCRFDHAEQLLAEARELDPQGVDAFRVNLVEGELLLRQGALDAARATLEQGRAGGHLLIDPQLLAPLFATLIECAVAQGDPAAATELLAEGRARLPERWHPYFEVPLHTAGVAAAMSQRPPLLAEARQGLARAEASAASIGWRPPLVEAELRTAAAAISDSEEAWAEAAEAWHGLGDRYRAALARLRGAEALLAAGGDRQVAASSINTAVADAREIGAHRLEALAEDLGRRSRLKLAADATSDNPYQLTRREREILGLVAEGLTDRAIGSRLFISHRTVERHVSNLLAKLGGDRRSELVATAHREGLVAGPGG
jgi:ATP/maltotriose-dependent transcriptional regulator MalT